MPTYESINSVKCATRNEKPATVSGTSVSESLKTSGHLDMFDRAVTSSSPL